MSFVVRPKKNIIDLRPIPIQGPKNYSYRWKMMALLELNKNGQYMLPFSRRLVDIGLPLWPRSNITKAPLGYEECGCIGCETKTYRDHILKDNDNESEYGDLHLEEVSVQIKDENLGHDDEIKSSGNSVQNGESESLSSTSFDSFSISDDDEDNDDNNEEDEGVSISMSPSLSYSPFLVDPYESYDWEC
ncbi:unnamed protein product [Rotaria sp. Silwood2]|nr:unnamed protein product [Rotaria sp. Silwood2]CAF3069339.1 unnamed protein product [Rotaria sp. Silwood2]CAF3378506.1 unnamed protein product [Rotaria sp. Silwood2]CAF4310409.1 unnamed protein product [Rotaria sp. Silwood2]CAF4416647.1 unnamed protein product [Rotaria sp. Silwood2]